MKKKTKFPDFKNSLNVSKTLSQLLRDDSYDVNDIEENQNSIYWN